MVRHPIVLTWSEVLGAEKNQPYFQNILARIALERDKGHVIFPPAADVFNAFRYTAFEDVRVVILGQDPYHGQCQAQGLSFSVPDGVAIPPSLRNIYKECAQDLNQPAPTTGNLQPWAQQGVLLLNTVLTVQAGQAHSHAGYGWERFTDQVIQQLNAHRQHLVFLLWGAHAQRKGQAIDVTRHLVLTAPHPSPLSAHRGFLGCGHFSATNHYLTQHGMDPIRWLSH